MIVSICGLLLLVISLLAMALQRFYSSIPAKELRRLANRGDHLAAILYRPVAYGASMRLLLWGIFVSSFSTGLLLLASGLVSVVAFAVIVLAVSAAIFLQSVRLTVHSARVAVHAAPMLSWVLTYLHVPLRAITRTVSKVRTHHVHSGLYEKEDLVALLQQQKEQVDNRISHRDLDALERAVRFDERQAADVLLPMARVKMVRMDDHIGPILLGELHGSGQTSFLVYNDTPDQVVGTLFLRDAVQAREGGRVADLVHPKLVFAHEDFTLRQVMQAFIRTSQTMVVVINSFEEAVGVITLDQLLAELIGTIQDDDLAYDDRASVAAFKPRQPEPDVQSDAAATDDAAPAEGPSSDEPDNVPASPEATEVVE
ncbi:MAG: CBS domain-containing protein [Candidatus Saccharimonadales bacterium]